MSADPGAGAPSGAGAGGPGPRAGAGPGGQPSEEELRAAYEAELARITSTDMMLQSAVSLLNIASYRLMPRPAAAAASASGAAEQPGAGQDLEQVRDAIDGVRALLEILDRRVPSELRPLRDALSQLQMAYAREMQASGGDPAADDAPSPGTAESGPGSSPAQQAPSAPGAPSPAPGGQNDPAQAPDDQDKRGPGPAESSGRLWVPGR
ncbi:MAG TPA: hypothetical protein VK774_02365 [Solirubrobacteraceae bacterium]|jgi:hypothetical protein|nr:hypothetical protein [Solirubrobacteraceae bacterium]